MIRTFVTDPLRLFFNHRFAVAQANCLATQTGIRQRVQVIKHPRGYKFQIVPVDL